MLFIPSQSIDGTPAKKVRQPMDRVAWSVHIFHKLILPPSFFSSFCLARCNEVIAWSSVYSRSCLSPPFGERHRSQKVTWLSFSWWGSLNLNFESHPASCSAGTPKLVKFPFSLSVIMIHQPRPRRKRGVWGQAATLAFTSSYWNISGVQNMEMGRGPPKIWRGIFANLTDTVYRKSSHFSTLHKHILWALKKSLERDAEEVLCSPGG